MVSNLRPTLTTITQRTVLYTAAHSGFDLSRVPLGGAATLCDLLVREWKKTNPFPFRLLGPGLLGAAAPRENDLVRYSERRYARFCHAFEAASTAEILRHHPAETVVLCNDVSEGPRFDELSEKGYQFFTIYHVNVVDYVAAMYGRGLLDSKTLAGLYQFFEGSPLRGMIPALFRLIFKKQRDSLLFSRGVIVPSEGMKRTLLRCYPSARSSAIHVVPWGTPDTDYTDSEVTSRAKSLRVQYGIPGDARVLVTLSRISPEKGQDRLLEALALWERRPDYPAEGVWVLVCGEAAYMAGARFHRRLERLAARLKKTRVIFPGYLSGLEKRAHFSLAELYVFPSRHESYGFTLLEAFRSGLPALAAHHYGAEELLKPEYGELLPPAAEGRVPSLLLEGLRRLLSDRERLQAMGERARAFASGRSFADTARTIGKIISA